MTLLEHALLYAENGLAVFPCNVDKTPRTPNGFKDATTESERIRRWWTDMPDASIGIATGRVSNLLVLDVDPRNGGAASLAEMVAKFGPVESPLRIRTGGGGTHYWMDCPRPTKSRSGFLPGLDLKADGGYVIAPPSPHPSGTPYSFESQGLRGTVHPIWLPNGNAKPKAAPLPAMIAEGARNATLMSLAGSMRRRGADEAAIFAALEVTNARCSPPMDPRELRSIARSACSYPTAADPVPNARPSQPAILHADILPFSQIVDQTFPPLDWLIDSILVGGSVGWIAGVPKTGKSMIALHAALSIAAGTPFLGRFDTRQGRALYVCEEDVPRIAFRRIRRMVAGLAKEDTRPTDDSFRILCKSGLKIDRQDHLSWLRSRLDAWKPDYVVLDVFNRIHDQDVNKADQIIPVIDAVDKLRIDYGCAIQIVSHFKKQQEGQTTDSPGQLISGTLALHAFSECSIWVYRKEGKRRLGFEAKEFEAHADIAFDIRSEGDSASDSPILFSCEDVFDNSEKGKRNRQIAVTALLETWESAGRPDLGVTTTVVMTHAVEKLGADYHVKTLKRHLLASGYLPEIVVNNESSWHPEHRS